MRMVRPPLIAGLVFPEAHFRQGTGDKSLCLTFDDGPDRESTPALLRLLDRHNIKALFFCSGEAAEKNPDLVERIIEEGHLIGNHGYRHIRGFTSSFNRYCDNAYKASPLTSASLFRPPYGSLTIRQYRELKKSFRIVFWDVMAYDFDPSFGPERSLLLLKRKIRPGSIIVLHDTPDSTNKFFLDRFLGFAVNQGYRFDLFL